MKPRPTPREIALGILALALLGLAATGLIYGMSKILTGTVGGAVAGGVVGLAVAWVSKNLEHQKQRQAALAEKKREVYRRMLAPWEQVLVHSKTGGGEDILAAIDLAALYSSAFDAVLYGSEPVVQAYVKFRSPVPDRDPLDMMRSLSTLLIAMREDVTGKKSVLPVETVLGTFINFSEEELVLLKLREYVAENPEAQKRVAELLSSSGATSQRGDEGNKE
jgi:hypothetical protein